MRKMVLRVSTALAVLCLAVTLNVYAEGGNKNHQIVVLDPTKPAPPLEDGIGGDGGGYVGYVCRCVKKTTSNCASVNSGNECAPDGTTKCWEYHRNCEKK